jgi:1-acyl-sn-glycerol-3-phosphate acyltransferase
VLWFFRGIVRRYFRRHFTAVRVTRDSHLAAFDDPRLIVYANHSSWWDPMLLVLLASRLMRKRRHFAPMDASALERYPIFKRIGVFGVEMHTARGAAGFLRASNTIIRDGGVLWITPQGRFADARERPLNLKPGLAALAAKMPGGCTVVPLAVEYVFWNERLPETLLHFGEPLHILEQTVDEAQQQVEAALLTAMGELQMYAIARDPSAFTVLHSGTVGTGGIYEVIQRTVARLRRQPFEPAHGAIVPQKERG